MSNENNIKKNLRFIFKDLAAQMVTRYSNKILLFMQKIEKHTFCDSPRRTIDLNAAKVMLKISFQNPVYCASGIFKYVMMKKNSTCHIINSFKKYIKLAI